MNHPLFYPFDEINQTEFKFPKNRREVDTNRSWLRHQERLSLWTIIERHILLGDLTVYRVYAPENPTIEDGDQLKYPIEKKGRDDFFTSTKYREDIIKCLAVGTEGMPWTVEDARELAKGATGAEVAVQKKWFSWLLNHTGVPYLYQMVRLHYE